MPALRSADRVSAHMATRGTRAPEGASPARPHGTGIYRDVPVWPGVTWGDDSRCACSWGYLQGVRQVKVRSGACTVHLPGRGPEAAEARAAQEAETSVAALIGQLVALLAEAAGEAGWLDACGCGTHNGYNQHMSDKTPVCPACRQGERDYSRERKRAQKLARDGQAWQEAA